MIDYSRWLSRAEAFVRGLDYLPGKWGVSIAVEPPLTASAADELGRTLPLGLPSPLYNLYTTGSASYRCTYHWSPDKAYLPLVEQVFPHQYSLYGGARFISAAELPDRQASVRSWATEWDAPADAPPRPGWELWHQAIPFLAVGNGDYLALQVSNGTDKQPVLYLSHDAGGGDDERTAFEISPSLEQFLADWETLCYVGPEIWLLGEFLANEGKGLLQVNQPKTNLWREVMLRSNKLS
jgi:hypothetical protein